MKPLFFLSLIAIFSTGITATTLNVFDSDDLENPFGQIESIATAETGAQNYDFFSASGHPEEVNLGARHSNIWVHEDTRNGEFSFGFIFGDEPSSFANSANFRFRITGSNTDTVVVVSDDPGEAEEIAPGTFEGTFSYNNANTDGIMVSGITGSNWTIIVDSVDFGAVNQWFAASGETSDFSDDLSLTLGKEYRITPGSNESGPSEVDVNGSDLIPEPSTYLLLVIGLAMGACWQNRR